MSLNIDFSAIWPSAALHDDRDGSRRRGRARFLRGHVEERLARLACVHIVVLRNHFELINCAQDQPGHLITNKISTYPNTCRPALGTHSPHIVLCNHGLGIRIYRHQVRHRLSWPQTPAPLRKMLKSQCSSTFPICKSLYRVLLRSLRPALQTLRGPLSREGKRACRPGLLH